MEILILILIAFFLFRRFLRSKSSIWKGRSGEKFVSRELNRLDLNYYKVLDDVMFFAKGDVPTTQIDHIVVSNCGIFCIETKAHKGWIFGNARQKFWTQVIFRRKERLYNPLWQNLKHVRVVESLVDPYSTEIPVVSLVIFVNAGRLQISNVSEVDFVGYIDDAMEEIDSYVELYISDAERDEIYEMFMQENITDKRTRKEHNMMVKDLRGG